MGRKIGGKAEYILAINGDLYLLSGKMCYHPGSLLTKKTLPYCYMDSHYKPETVVSLSEVYNGDLYTCKTVSFLVNGGPDLVKSQRSKIWI